MLFLFPSSHSAFAYQPLNKNVWPSTSVPFSKGSKKSKRRKGRRSNLSLEEEKVKAQAQHRDRLANKKVMKRIALHRY